MEGLSARSVATRLVLGRRLGPACLVRGRAAAQAAPHGVAEARDVESPEDEEGDEDGDDEVGHGDAALAASR